MKRAFLAMCAIAVVTGCTSTATKQHRLGIGPVLEERKRGIAALLARRLAEARPGSVIEFSAFSDLDYVAVTDSVVDDDGVELWQGSIGDRAFWGSAIVAVEGNDIVGTVQVDDRVYSIRTDDDDLVITEIDETLFPEEAEPLRRESGAPGPRPPAPGPATEEAPVTLRVLLVIPPQLSKWCTSRAARLMASMSQASVDGVWARFTHGAVGTDMSVYCTDHNATGTIYTDLDWVANDPDVKAQRAATKSNMVAFIVPEAGNCGQSYANYPVDDPEANTRAFSVVRFDCAWENYSLAHELGHQLGMDHDRYTIKGGYLDRCNYGYSFMKDGKPVARDVMAYSGYCDSLGVKCPRIGTYSYPATIDGVQFGIPCSVTGDTNPATGAADNVEQLLLAAPVAATWH